MLKANETIRRIRVKYYFVYGNILPLKVFVQTTDVNVGI